MGFLGVQLHLSPHGYKCSCVCRLAPGIPEITVGPSIRTLDIVKHFCMENTGPFQSGLSCLSKHKATFTNQGRAGPLAGSLDFCIIQTSFYHYLHFQIIPSQASQEVLQSPLGMEHFFGHCLSWIARYKLPWICRSRQHHRGHFRLRMMTQRHFPDTQDSQLIWRQGIGRKPEVKGRTVKKCLVEGESKCQA